ncbi:MAG: methyltransferase domain-containing protein [bacterium]
MWQKSNMEHEKKFNLQFEVEQRHFLEKLDFVDWFRYFYIIKEVIDFTPDNVLEIGVGSGMVKNCLKPIVKNYMVMDVNKNLQPDIVNDVRIYQDRLKCKFECVIAADILEHMPFSDLERSLKNIYSYLKNKGIAIITIPHRRTNFLFMTPTNKPHVFTLPTGFLSPGAFYRRFIKRKIWIDPDHCWEIGDGRIKKHDVETLFKKCGYEIYKFRKLFYVDFWVLFNLRTKIGNV